MAILGVAKTHFSVEVDPLDSNIKSISRLTLVIVCGKIIKCNIIIQVQSCVSGAAIKMAWWLLFYLGKVWLLMLALKASTVEACGIRGGKL